MKVLFLILVLFTNLALGKTLGDPNAIKGGTFTVGYPGYPKTLLFYLAFDELSEGVNSLVSETLLDQNLETYDFIPLLASEWTVSPDKMLFTFKIDPRAQFSDGTPVTANDVKFTWDTILNPKNKTAPFQAEYSSIESCTVVDDHTVQFKAKTLHFKNFEKLAGLIILQKHFFSKGDFNKGFHTKLLGSGPYTLESVKQGERIFLKRNPKYWGASLPQNIGRYNFDRIVFKTVNDYNVQFELFKKGDIDYFYFLSSKMWATETDAPPFHKNYVKKLKAENLLPFATQGIAWNLRRPLFQDRRVRLALSHLMNREKWIKELMYSNYVASTGVVGVNSEYRAPANAPIPYDPKRARELLKEAGWVKVGSDGVLVKDGMRFEFEILIDNPMLQKHLTLYQEDLKKMGIRMNIRTVDWATAIKLTDDRQFDGRELARGRAVHPSDFEVMWGSKYADLKASVNFTGYKNPEVDKLASQIDQTFEKEARIPLVRKLDEIIAQDQPMSFAWEPTYFRLAYWNKFSFPGQGYFNYSNWKTTFHFWWLDPKKEAKLKKAMAEGQPVTD